LARRGLGPSLVWHFQMLAQVLGEFQLAKTRSRQLQQLSYLKAVHETGARLTHDVKNLLQSLNTLCFAAEREGTDASPQFQSLLLRQLPAISQRLQQTLEKLKQPTAEMQEEIPAYDWWNSVLRRYTLEHVRLFAIGLREEVPVPAALFNSTLENLLENAMRKRSMSHDLAVSVTLDMTRGITLKVCDNGESIPAAVTKDLFRAPVASEFGLGIGLYQVARQAEWYGYLLTVAANDPGRVCIELKRREPEGTRS
jgi:signal transduction histidine kinase